MRTPSGTLASYKTKNRKRVFQMLIWRGWAVTALFLCLPRAILNATDILVEFGGIVEALKADLRERRGGYLVKVAEISGRSDPTGRTRNN